MLSDLFCVNRRSRGCECIDKSVLYSKIGSFSLAYYLPKVVFKGKYNIGNLYIDDFYVFDI